MLAVGLTSSMHGAIGGNGIQTSVPRAYHSIMQVVEVDLVTPTMVRQEEVVAAVVMVETQMTLGPAANGVVNSGGGGGGLSKDGGSGVVQDIKEMH